MVENINHSERITEQWWFVRYFQVPAIILFLFLIPPFMDERFCIPDSASSSSAYWLLLQVLSLIPLCHYLLLAAFIFFSVLYNFLELHFFQDLFSGFAGSPVLLSYNSSSQIYHDVVSKCEVLRGRYFATPWLCSPHLQTLFLNYFGTPPLLKYTRSIQPSLPNPYLFVEDC